MGTISLPKYRKTATITDDIRQQITGGSFSRGQQLPTRVQLQQTYDVSSVTLQRALDTLLDEGFLESHGRRGTFVTQNPPHLANYALLFPHNFGGDKPQNLLYRALYEEATALTASDSGKQIACTQGFSGRAGFLEYESILEDVQQNRLAGLIFTAAPHLLIDTPILADDGIPRTAITSKSPADHISAVYFDLHAQLKLVADHLASQGRKRLACLVISALPAHTLNVLRTTMQQHQIHLDDDHLIGLSNQQPDWARRVVRLIFKQPAHLRPDALFIMDDNLIAPATQAIQELGLRLPEDLAVVANANFPYLPNAHCPITRIGFSVPRLLATCMHNIDLARQGKTPAPITYIPPSTNNPNR